MVSARDITLYAFLLLFGVLSYLVLAPFIPYIILGLVFAFLFYPIYKLMAKAIWESLAATIVVVLVLLCIVIPSVYVAGTIVIQATDTYHEFRESGFNIDEHSVSELIYGWTGYEVHGEVVDLFDQGRRMIRASLPGLITSTGAFLLGLFIFFFILYFALREGPAWFANAMELLPIGKEQREQVADKLWRQSRALLYGQILTSLIIGIVVGTAFHFLGVPNPVFWGFLMVVLGIIPVLGAFIVYVPGGIYLMARGLWVEGIALLAIALVTQFVVDYVLRPKIVSKASEIHPTFVILGALGGIALMGIVGFVVGPLILSFFFTLLEFDPRISGSRRARSRT